MHRQHNYWLYGMSIGTYLFLYLPLCVVVWFSFNSSPLNAEWEGFTGYWYQQLFHDDRLFAATRNSVVIALVSSAAATFLGTLAGIAMHQFKLHLLPLLVLIPIAIPELLMGCSLVIFFVAINQCFTELFNWDFLALGFTTVIIAHIAFCIGLVAIVVCARLKGMDASLVEAARDLGATPFQAFRLVTLPVIMPSIIVSALMSFTLSLDDFVITFFTAGAGVTTLPLEIYTKIRVTATPEINAVSTLLILFSLVVTVLVMRIAPRVFRGQN
ncbi:MAG: ABC transporter permease [Neisseriales bacterium]|nr:MAG: ABC transporter permease [Neisseriales bacterium]